MDSIEKKIGKSVSEMTSDQLLTYFEWGKAEVTGSKNPPGGAKQSATFKSFQERYGRDEAGKMVQHAVFKKKCEHDGKPLGVGSFSEGSKWLTDIIQDEMNKNQKRSDPEREKELRAGFSSLMDL